ncbi:MAG: post-COAP-1 domain-containing protein [Euryarchaeota archaeon]|nr:post-COAP-1 domain-containing protein [Euryarchaeota archaeon]
MEIRGIVTTTVLILALIAISTASASADCWVANTSWDAPDVGIMAVPAFADLDCDGDYDLLIGDYGGVSYGYENVCPCTPPDTTPPVITITTPVPYGLYTVGMTLNFSATDDESGVDTVVGNLTNTSEVSQNVDSGFAPAVGVYTLVVTATDNASNTNVSDPVFFVVYDPNGGHATGGGWFYPDENSTLPDGKANFGFTARYKDGSSTGKLNFQYKDAGIHLKSTSIDWLTISAVSAQFQGTGTINGDGLYTFRVKAKDNGEPGAGTDHFDIKIWNGTDTEADPYHKAKNTISGGNIQVHTN